jgi:hypothetical protein
MKSRDILIFALLIVATLILYMKRDDLKVELNEAFQTLQVVERDGVLLNYLRNRWENRDEKEKMMRYLENISPSPKIKTKGNRITISFEPMEKAEFEKVSKKILQSTLEIGRFSVERVSDFNVTLSLEVEK